MFKMTLIGSAHWDFQKTQGSDLMHWRPYTHKYTHDCWSLGYKLWTSQKTLLLYDDTSPCLVWNAVVCSTDSRTLLCARKHADVRKWTQGLCCHFRLNETRLWLTNGVRIFNPSLAVLLPVSLTGVIDQRHQRPPLCRGMAHAASWHDTRSRYFCMTCHKSSLQRLRENVEWVVINWYDGGNVQNAVCLWPCEPMKLIGSIEPTCLPPRKCIITKCCWPRLVVQFSYFCGSLWQCARKKRCTVVNRRILWMLVSPCRTFSSDSQAARWFSNPFSLWEKEWS